MWILCKLHLYLFILFSLLGEFFQLHVQYYLRRECFFVVGSHDIFHDVYYNSQQTPVSEDTTALFGPPLETTFGEPKIEGKPILSLFIILSLCLFVVVLVLFFGMLILLVVSNVLFCLPLIPKQWKRLFWTHIHIVSLRLPAKPCLAVIADILSARPPSPPPTHLFL